MNANVTCVRPLRRERDGFASDYHNGGSSETESLCLVGQLNLLISFDLIVIEL